jgi:hypothetical protein
MQGITDLVLSYATSLAGFEVTTYGRFSGDHRGDECSEGGARSPSETI